MGFVFRWFRSTVIFLAILVVLWVIAMEAAEQFSDKIANFLTWTATYIIVAYMVVPPLIHLSLILFRSNRIPRVCRSADGLPAHPVNVILVGSKEALLHGFLTAGWDTADPLTIRTGWKMVDAFIRNKPYPTAPFSHLYLFGRIQDIGFQLPIGGSPRKRHHVRFWAVNTDTFIDPLDTRYWSGRQPVDWEKPVMWVGVANEDVGLGFSALTFQITHRVDRDVDRERDFVVASLREAGCIGNELSLESGEYRIGRYATDGRMLAATLAVPV